MRIFFTATFGNFPLKEHIENYAQNYKNKFKGKPKTDRENILI